MKLLGRRVDHEIADETDYGYENICNTAFLAGMIWINFFLTNDQAVQLFVLKFPEFDKKQLKNGAVWFQTQGQRKECFVDHFLFFSSNFYHAKKLDW